MLNKVNSSQHEKMISLQKEKSKNRVVKIKAIIKEFSDLGAQFKNITIYAKAIAQKLEILEGGSISHTILIKKLSPYRSLLVEAMAKNHNVEAASKNPNYEKIEMALQIRELKEQLLSKDRIISNLLAEITHKDDKLTDLVTDKLPGEEIVDQYFIPFKKLLDESKQPKGYLIFDPYSKTLMEPLRKQVVFDSFPPGFLEWYIDTYVN